MEELVVADGTIATPADNHPLQTFAATGGSRVAPKTIAALTSEIEALAVQFGYPTASAPAERVGFDRAAAEAIFDFMKVTAFEASQPGVWTFLSLAAMPHITNWRFGLDNRERWIASDLTRHMFARLWWQAFTFGIPSTSGAVDYSLLRSLSESDLNQLTERRSIGGNQRVARAVAAEWTAHSVRRRSAIRDLAKGLRRLTVFVDFASLGDDDLNDLVRSTVLAAVGAESN